MRDIRDDLRERANLIMAQINAAQGQFDNLVEQIKIEHDSKVEKLKSQLDAIQKVNGIEDRRLGSDTSASRAEPQPSPLQLHPLRQQAPLNFHTQKISAVRVR